MQRLDLSDGRCGSMKELGNEGRFQIIPNNLNIKR